MSSNQAADLREPARGLIVGDALDALTTLSSCSVDAVITDPPYAIKRPARSDASQPNVRQATCTTAGCGPSDLCVSCRRALAVARFAQSHMLGQQSPNWHAKETHSRGYADNDPREFQTWCQLWLDECLRILKPGGHLVAFGGTRTWHRLAAAAEDVGFEIRDSLAWLYSSGMPKSLNVEQALADTGDLAASNRWAGAGTALKPAFEPVVLARKPLDGTMVHNVTTWGVGPLRLSATRTDCAQEGRTPPGKWPSNVHMDEHQARALAVATGQDASQFFWVSKPNRMERVVVDGIAHPTVKPLALMRHLVRLVTPERGLVVDPFAGSGTTIEACVIEGRGFVGIERDERYRALIEARLARHDAPDAEASDYEPVESATADAELRLF